MARIRKAVTNRVLTELKTRARDSETYTPFWENFGSVMKEGLWDDTEHRATLAELMRFRSSTQGGWTSLSAYVERMKPEQEAIYILVGDDASALAASPQLEGFGARGLEVLLLSDPVDAFWPERMTEHDGKPIRSVTQGAADLSKFTAETQPGEAADTTKLVEALKAALGSQVEDIRTTDRLTGSAVVLAAKEHGPDLQLQRMMRRTGRGGAGTPILEINPRHPLIAALANRAESGDDLKDVAETLLDVALVQDGEAPRDPAAFARRITASLVG